MPIFRHERIGMKKKFMLILVSVVLVTCLLFSVACGGDNTPSRSGNANDASNSGTANTTASASSQSDTASATASVSLQNDTANATASTPSQIDNKDWAFDAASGKLVIRGSGNMADYSAVNCPWQEYKASIKSVEISDGVTSIGAAAFKDCALLTDITVPDGVKRIEGDAFKDCALLKNINIPDSVESIHMDAFWGCNKLQYNEIYNGCYLGNENNPYLVLIKAKLTDVESFNIHNDTRIIYASALSRMNITSIRLSKNIKSIGAYAFSEDESLNDVYYDGDIGGWVNIYFEEVNANPLYKGAKLYTEKDGEDDVLAENIVIDTLNEIKANAFIGCTSLTSVTITDDVTNIGDDAFNGCTSLTSIKIGNSVTGIGKFALSGCTSLESVTIGNNVTSMETSAFLGCKKLTEVKYDGNIAGWCNITFGSETANPLYTDFANPTYKVVKLKTKVGEEYEEITEIVIPKTVTEIKAYAFVTYTSLTKVKYDGDIAGWCNITFGNGFSNPLMYAHDLYLSEKESSEKDIIIPNTVNEIKTFAFYGCSLESITLGNGVNSIGVSAFSECTSLKSVTIGNSVTSIGMYAFSNCKVLENITIPDSVTNIGAYAFRKCTALENITIPDSVTSIGKEAFKDCNSLKCTELNDGLYLGNKNNSYLVLIKAKSTNITSCTIHNDTKFISSEAFSECTSLTSVTIGQNVISIEKDAFKDCAALTSVCYNGDQASWERIVFGNEYANPLNNGAELYYKSNNN